MCVVQACWEGNFLFPGTAARRAATYKIKSAPLKRGCRTQVFPPADFPVAAATIRVRKQRSQPDAIAVVDSGTARRAPTVPLDPFHGRCPLSGRCQLSSVTAPGPPPHPSSFVKNFVAFWCRAAPATGNASATEQPTPTYTIKGAQDAKSGCAGCALSSPSRTPNQTAVAKKGDTGLPTANAPAIESRLMP